MGQSAVAVGHLEIVLSSHGRTDRFIGASVLDVLHLLRDAPSMVRTWVCCDASSESFSVRDSVV